MKSRMKSRQTKLDYTTRPDLALGGPSVSGIEPRECPVGPEEAAAFLKMARSTVMSLARAGRIPAHPVTNGTDLGVGSGDGTFDEQKTNIRKRPSLARPRELLGQLSSVHPIPAAVRTSPPLFCPPDRIRTILGFTNRTERAETPKLQERLLVCGRVPGRARGL
jgi:hypothetical protein